MFKTFVGDTSSRDDKKRLFKEYPLLVLDCILKLSSTNDDFNYVDFLTLATRGKLGRLRKRFYMPLYVRIAIMSHDKDPAYSYSQTKKALNHVVISKKKLYSRHDIMLFYCVMVRFYAFNGNIPNCIMTLKQLEHCLLDCDLSHPTLKDIQRRTKSLLSVICNVKSGSYFEEARSLITPLDIKNLMTVENAYRVLHVAFAESDDRLKWWDSSKRHRIILYSKLVELYFNLENPLCGPYQRGHPEQRVKCLNEFLLIYTDKPRMATATENDIDDIETRYPEIKFNRNNLKFLKHVIATPHPPSDNTP